ncbi:MAG: ABC transporter ATP-binding protein [Prevotellaceae bacterium]|jgi:ABC-type multidrug transport system ATPase subunit|nr:ABC transporter ATP-binding protein [Prevotellaceae bacterium]
MIAVTNISKRYGAVQALSDVRFSVDRGELFGLIGPDGAGKTSLLRILATLLLPDAGEATIDGLNTVADYRAVRRRIGYMPGRFSLYRDLTVEENLRFFASIFGTTVRENEAFIRPIFAPLEPFRRRRAGALSGGMKQKLALSCALIHRPDALLLDEPTTGVDALSRKEFWEMLHELKQHGIAILVSTPYMDEASRCDRVALIRRGQTGQIDTPQQVVAQFPHRLFAVRTDNAYRLACDLPSWPTLHAAYPFGACFHVIDRRPHIDISAELTAFLHQRGHSAVECLPATPTMEDCFMEWMKRDESE